MRSPQSRQPASGTRERRIASSFASTVRQLSKCHVKSVCQLRGPCRIYGIPPSTERKDHAIGNRFAEDRVDLPSLQDLLDELEVDCDLDSLEQLAHGLLQDVARDLESAAQEADQQEQSDIRRMVGQTPEQLESGGPEPLIRKQEQQQEEEQNTDVSEFLLLHHDYAAKPPASPLPARPEPRPIRPKTEGIVYGVLEEGAGVVTVFACASPVSCSGSDGGYESVGSPSSVQEDVVWDRSLSELFPSLL